MRGRLGGFTELLYSLPNSESQTSEIFYEYLANCFIPSLNEMRRQEKNLQASEALVLTETDWVVYWIDGYSSHLTLHASRLCELNHIHLYCFKAHASHICQPNNVGPFKPLKAEWKQAVSEWRQIHPHQALTRQVFAPLLGKTLAGYKATGLYPWNVDAVHYGNLTTKRRLENPSSAVVGSSQPCENAENQKPKLIIEPGPHTSGYTVAFRRDESHNIVITHIFHQLDSADTIGLSKVADNGAMASIDSDVCQSFQMYLGLDEALTGGDLHTSQSDQSNNSEITELLAQFLSSSAQLTQHKVITQCLQS